MSKRGRHAVGSVKRALPGQYRKRRIAATAFAIVGAAALTYFSFSRRSTGCGQAAASEVGK